MPGEMMKKAIWLAVFLSINGFSQIEDRIQSQKSETPIELELPRTFEQKMLTRDQFEEFREKNELKIQQRKSQIDALEAPVIPDRYLLGPGDLLAFNVWGPDENKKYMVVSSEGILPVPSIGEINVIGRSLKEVQDTVACLASGYFSNARISISLESLRFFRVHVVGEIKYPGTYLAQATHRVSDLIEMAGGITRFAWTRKIELRHISGKADTVDLDDFFTNGETDHNLFVTGGDVVFVRPIDLNRDHVRVDGNLKVGGFYPISRNEDLYEFCLRIRAFENNVDLGKIGVIRESGEKLKEDVHFPFSDSLRAFPLHSGDLLVLPIKHVYVKGAVRNPGAYPFMIGFTAKDYVGLAGGDYQSGGIKSVTVYRAKSGKIDKGPKQIVSDGDVVDLPQSLGNRTQNYISAISAFASLIIAAKAVGFLGKE